MKKYISFLFLIFVFIWSVNIYGQNFDSTENKNSLNNIPLSGISFRSIGPAITGGRIVDIEVNPKNNSEYYIASGHGNLWKTTNRGITFFPTFDNQNSYSIGAVTLDPQNPNVVWVATGENNAQSNVIPGDGVYKSEDAGKTWKNMGLKNSEQLGEIIIHPNNSNIVWVAAYGSHRKSGGQRGVFRTKDGGKTWDNVLNISENTGCWQLHIDPRNPNILYAVAHQRQRFQYTIISGGDESGIYKTTDGGDNWVKLKGGLPQKDVGRIGMDISPVNPDVLFAVVYAKKGTGVYKSTDMGASWTKQSSYKTAYPFYLQNIVCDPENIDRLYALDVFNKISIDGGKTWSNLGEDKKHVDNHALWIDPENPKHMLSGNDGGLYETYDRGKNWNFKANIPIAEIYKVTVDNDKPFYNVYIGTQDNNSLGGPSRTVNSGGISNSDWYFTWGGDGFETQVDWKNPNIIYSQSQFGGLTRYDKKTGERLYIKAFEEKGDSALRFDWDAPLLISAFDNKRLYHGANKVLRTDDMGSTWKIISPDLTRGIPQEMDKLMGRSWSIDELASKRSLAQLSTIAESPLDENILFTGSADGLIHYTIDGGKNWHKSIIEGLPPYARVNQIIASNHDKNIAYAACQMHFAGDYQPYLYKTIDGGKNWFSISTNLPDRGCTYTIAEDFIDPDLLFVGTMFGVYVSNTKNIHWVKLKNGIPNTAVFDMDIQKDESDLVVSTFGRGVYILDDYSALRKLKSINLQNEAVIFPVPDALMFVAADPLGFPGTGFQGASYFTAPNPQIGANITYYIKQAPKSLKEKRREKEKELQKENKDITYPDYETLKKEKEEEKPFLLFTFKDKKGNIIRRIKKPFKKGLQRLVWDFRFNPVSPVSLNKNKNLKPWENPDLGYMVAPGQYSVSLSKFQNGEWSDLSGPEVFNCKPLNLASIPVKDYEILANFNKKVAELGKQVYAMDEYRKELNKMIPYLEKAILLVESLDPFWYKNIYEIKKELRNLNIKINGDQLLSKYEGASRTSFKDKIDLITSGLWSTTSLQTNTYEKAYKDVEDDFNKNLKSLLEIDRKIKSLKKALKDAGAPYIPGNIPELKK